MARGSNKGSSKLQAFMDDASYRLPKKADFKAMGVKVMNEVETKPEVHKAVKKFLSTLENYQGDSHFEKVGSHKQRRQAIVDAFLALPGDIRSIMEVPKDYLARLYRGASHATNPGPDGTINASFSSSRYHALEFAPKGWVGQRADGEYSEFKKYEPSKANGIYTAKDIESIGGIINFSAINKFCEGIADEYVARERRYNSDHGMVGSLIGDGFPKDSKGYNIYYEDKHPKHEALYEMAKEHAVAAQNEFLVYHIKWKAGVK